MKSEIIIFNGTKFRRYPQSKNRSDRVYFTPGIEDKKNGIKRLHEEMWKHHYGKIPEGKHIHHKDGDPLNNKISNLECLTASEHLKAHWSKERSDAQAKWADKIRHLSKKWHASPEGRRWHLQHIQDMWKNLREKPKMEIICYHCGKKALVLPRKIKKNRFCSVICIQKSRREREKLKKSIDDRVIV